MDDREQQVPEQNQNVSPFSPYGGRRFLICVGSAGICTALLMFGYIEGTIFRDLILGTVGVYVAGNTSQKVFGR